MTPLIDPRRGDIEDDASSLKLWSLASAGWVLVEISLPKLLLSWALLVGLPCLLLGAAPLLATAWFSSVSRSVTELVSGVAPLLVFAGLLSVALLGVRPAFRIAEQSFWSLNALAVQPSFVLCREAMRHFIGPKACWIVALHHHLVEYPRATRSLSERIGTARSTAAGSCAS